MDIQISWISQTVDGLFGRLVVMDGGVAKLMVVCDTNLKLRIKDGVYTARVDMSPRLSYMCPHIKVPIRDQAAGGDAGLRIHKANEPAQSLGCIFPGEQIEGDAVDDSKDAFDAMMALLPQDDTEFSISIQTLF